MLKLRGSIQAVNVTAPPHGLVRITAQSNLPRPLRKKAALFLNEEEATKWLYDGGNAQDHGFHFVLLCLEKIDKKAVENLNISNVYLASKDYDYLSEGDIVRVNGDRQTISTLFRKSAPNNSILLTERCNHLCLMCSQPPKNVDDSWLINDAFELLQLIPVDTKNIGFTGGEPTTYGDRFIQLIESAKRNLPGTALDVLTNGRAFKDEAYAAKLGRIKHGDLQLGIPLYSDDPVRHDYIVQSKGAFDETIRGILNLKRHGVRVEIRLVIHQQTLPRLIQTCEFITRNLLFVDHVALMGLEITGFTRANMDILWADPYEYKDALSEAIATLRAYGMHCSVYNHQLCLVNPDVEVAYRKSISDWKNEYLSECDECSRKSECGGFFSTQVMYRHSDNIKPFS